MYGSIKYEVTPPKSETNRLNYFQNLHSNHEPLSSDQQKVVSELRKRGDTLMQSRPLDYPLQRLKYSQWLKKKERTTKVHIWIVMHDKKRND